MRPRRPARRQRTGPPIARHDPPLLAHDTFPAPPVTTAHPSPTRWRALRSEMIGLGGVLLATLVAAWHLLRGGTMIGEDAAAFFYPMFAELGRRLAAGDIPAWSTHQLSGAPFAADPQSGWGYVPAMLLFALFPLAAAVQTMLMFHLALAGLATYALGRVLGLGIAGALIGAVAYQHAALTYLRADCCMAHIQVGAWFPALLVGAELALQSRTWRSRIVWWGAAAFALSQIFAGWLGQGAYYTGLVLGGYLLYRTLIAPAADPGRRPLARVVALLLHSAAIGAWGVALAATGILPRLEYNGQTFLAGGVYGGQAAGEAIIGGWTVRQAVTELLGHGVFFTGGAVLALAALAGLARGRHATPAFAALAIGILLLTGPALDPNPIQTLLYHLLPRFESINRHFPQRATLVFALAPALLAGATVDALPSWRHRRWLVLALAWLPLGAGLLIATRDVTVPRPTLVAAALAGALIVASVLVPGRITAARWLIPAALMVLVVADLQIGNRGTMIPSRDFHRTDLDRYYAPGGAGRFLQQAALMEPPFRFVGYDPGIHPPTDLRAPLYRYHFADPRTYALIVNNRASVLGLDDVQGYNPIQSRRYVEFQTALNGFVQEYREANVYAGGLSSPLLDLLNARYIVIPAQIPADRLDLQQLVRDDPTVYQDDQSRVLLNQDAVPRAWIVHQAIRMERDGDLTPLANGSVDPRQVALLETDLPSLAQPTDPTADVATIVSSEPDVIRLRTGTGAPGLLMLSEITSPGWHATVDGRAVDVEIADHALRAVPIPAGEHTVELRYQPRSLRIGLIISLAALLLLAAAVVWRWWPAGRRRGGSNGGSRRAATTPDLETVLASVEPIPGSSTHDLEDQIKDAAEERRERHR